MFSLYLRTYLTINKINKREFCENIGFHETYLHKVLNGSINPSNQFKETVLKELKIKNLAPFKPSIHKELNNIINDSISLTNNEYHIEVYPKDLTYPYQLLFKYFNLYYSNKFNNNFYTTEENLFKIIKYFEPKYQHFFYTIYAYSLIRNKDFDQALEVLNKASDIPIDNQYQQGLTYYYYLISYNHFGDWINALKYAEKAENIFKDSNYTLRKTKILTAKAATYNQIGDIDRSLEINKQVLEQSKNTPQRTLGIVYNNIGWKYVLKKDYKTALQYYQEAIKYRPTDYLCFDIAWCYYKLGNNSKALEYLELSKNVEEIPKYGYLICDWLKEMILHPYNRECLRLLKRIEKICLETKQHELTILIYTQLAKYYEHKKDFEMAYAYSKKIIELKVITNDTL